MSLWPTWAVAALTGLNIDFLGFFLVYFIGILYVGHFAFLIIPVNAQRGLRGVPQRCPAKNQIKLDHEFYLNNDEIHLAILNMYSVQ
jgi:hypothetical protein